MGKIKDDIGKIYWFRDSNGYHFKGKYIGNEIYQTIEEFDNYIFSIGNDIKKTGDATPEIIQQFGVDWVETHPIVIATTADKYGTVRINDHNSHMADALSHTMPLEMKSKEELIKEIRKLNDAMRIMQVNNKTVEKALDSQTKRVFQLENIKKLFMNCGKKHKKEKDKLWKKIMKQKKTVRFWMERSPPLEPKSKTMCGTPKEIIKNIIDEHSRFIHYRIDEEELRVENTKLKKEIELLKTPFKMNETVEIIQIPIKGWNEVRDEMIALRTDRNNLREKVLKLKEVNGDKIIELEKSLHIANQYSEAMVLLVDQHCAEKDELKKQLVNK